MSACGRSHRQAEDACLKGLDQWSGSLTGRRWFKEIGPKYNRPIGNARGDRIPTSKKQLEKLNKIKKAKAEELAKQAASGSESAKKKLKKLQKKIK